MEKSICNVIWVDDEIENICPEFGLGGLKRYLKKENIKENYFVKKNIENI